MSAMDIGIALIAFRAKKEALKMRNIILLAMICVVLSGAPAFGGQDDKASAPAPNLLETGTRVCQALEKNDFRPMFDFLFHPSLLGVFAEIEGMPKSNEEITEFLLGNMALMAETSPIMKCTAGPVTDRECPDFAHSHFAEFGLKVEKCATIGVKMELGGDKPESIDNSGTAALVEGKWYLVLEDFRTGIDYYEEYSGTQPLGNRICRAITAGAADGVTKLRLPAMLPSAPGALPEIALAASLRKASDSGEEVLCSTQDYETLESCPAAVLDRHRAAGVELQACGYADLSIVANGSITARADMVRTGNLWYLDQLAVDAKPQD